MPISYRPFIVNHGEVRFLWMVAAHGRSPNPPSRWPHAGPWTALLRCPYLAYDEYVALRELFQTAPIGALM